jgi:hypothetical protein
MTSLEPMPATGKPAAQSLTLWGAAAALAGLLVHAVLSRMNVAPGDVQQAAQDISDIITATGSLVAIWGRMRASRPITTLIKKES